MFRALALLLALLLAACAGKPRRDTAATQAGVDPSGQPAAPAYEPVDGPPSMPFDVDQLVEPVPKVEPRSRYGNHSPYVVLGKRYTVMDSSRGYVERGVASWYGTKFHGRLTSNREPYDMFAFTAAHKTLPLPSYVRVTHLGNGRSIVVRVNDRGPFVGDRIIDLSYAAAVRLGVHLTGTALVEVRAIDPAGEPAPGGKDYLQVGAFSERANARALADRLKQAGLGPVKLVRSRSEGRRIYRVRLGPYVQEAERLAAEQALRAIGITPVRIHFSH